MNKPSDLLFTARPTITLELPLEKHARILRPEQIILKIADKYYDIGALCYAVRSKKRRRSGQPREVVTSSLLKRRPKQILQLIRALSNLRTDGGSALDTIARHAYHMNQFIDLSDAAGLHDCLAGGEATFNSFRAWATATKERYQKQEIGEHEHNFRLTHVCEMLEAMTGLENLMQGIRKVKVRSNPNGGTKPLALGDFAHAVALNQSLFDGLCDLVLEMRPFPFKLDLPSSLGWAENHLWLFPTNTWRSPPHLLRDDAIRANRRTRACWAYDYENGRLATIDEIEHRYTGNSRWERRHVARAAIKNATARVAEANANAQDTWRFTLGMFAQRAFLFLFICNTGGNAQVVRSLETDGAVDATVSNQRFRSIKWRASGKKVTLVAPATFMPRLRRFMELRKYLLQGRKTPYLFFSCGNRNNALPAQIRDFHLENYYRQQLIEIDPQLPRMGPRALRASVDDYYIRLHDSVVAAAVMGHTVETEYKKYARGSANDHRDELTLFMESVSQSARRQRVIPPKDVVPDTPPLEQGGRCDCFGHPEALAALPPIQPNCQDSQGCLFCSHRVLIAGEEDARKVASAAYVMEQLILGPKHEEELRPSIAKCDEDLEKIAAFPDCRAMVEKVRKDVFENENLTPFWADTKITKDSVSLEAGRKKGTIKKSRPVFCDLIEAIDTAATAEINRVDEMREQLDQAKAETAKYRSLWEEAVAREVSLVKELWDAREAWAKEREAMTRGNVTPIRKPGENSSRS